METAAIRRPDSEEDTTPTGELRLTRRADGRLWATRGGTERAVWVRRCFPWSEPARFVSLRDDDQQEFALVRDPADLDAASRRVLEEALVAAGFVFQITRVTAIEEEVDIRHWRVETRQGTRSFQTRLATWRGISIISPIRPRSTGRAGRWCGRSWTSPERRRREGSAFRDDTPPSHSAGQQVLRSRASRALAQDDTSGALGKYEMKKPTRLTAARLPRP